MLMRGLEARVAMMSSWCVLHWWLCSLCVCVLVFRVLLCLVCMVSYGLVSSRLVQRAACASPSVVAWLCGGEQEMNRIVWCGVVWCGVVSCGVVSCRIVSYRLRRRLSCHAMYRHANQTRRRTGICTPQQRCKDDG